MTHPCQRVGDQHILWLPEIMCELDEGKEMKADLEGSAEDAEFDERHGYAVVQRRGNRGWQPRLDRALYSPLTPPDIKISRDVIEMLDQIHPSHPPSCPIPSSHSLSLQSFEIGRKFSTPQNTSHHQATLRALNDKRMSRCGAYVVTGDHDMRSLSKVDLRLLSYKSDPLRSALLSPTPSKGRSLLWHDSAAMWKSRPMLPSREFWCEKFAWASALPS
jgi:hypothetical protein